LARRPYTVVHVAVSVDGATTGFEPDQGRFYELAAKWDEDVTLAGSDTILAQEAALASAPLPGPAEDGPLLAVVDGLGRVRQWDLLRRCGHWSDVVALRSEATPEAARGEPERELVAGADRVDLGDALTRLASDGARTVRVDSGGGLTGALLGDGLVDELSLLIHPVLVGGDGPRWHGPGRTPSRRLEPVASESFGDGVVWLRYRVGSTA
jgi:2,5-diamino-6-(ribosylamino)-4(3H)-pyrimidinone 5'-phosphate reductase